MSIYFACTQVHQETNTTFTAQYPGSIQATRAIFLVGIAGTRIGSFLWVLGNPLGTYLSASATTSDPMVTTFASPREE